MQSSSSSASNTNSVAMGVALTFVLDGPIEDMMADVVATIPLTARRLVARGIGLQRVSAFPQWIVEADLSGNALVTLHGLASSPSGEESQLESLDVSYNALTNLAGLPLRVRNLRASRNKISTLADLAGHTSLVNLGISCNHLSNMIGCPPQVRSMVCTNNFLVSWQGFPAAPMDKLYASYNSIRDMQGAPNVLNFDCSANLITSLVGCPEGVIEFNASNNALTSPDGCPASAQIVRLSGNRISSIDRAWSNQVRLIEATKNPIINHNRNIASLASIPEVFID